MKENNKMKLKAFTMAEAILVMTILGVIAAIMIANVKPTQYKEQALTVLAKKILGEVDAATSQILINDTKYGNFDSLYYSSSDLSLLNIKTADAVNDFASKYKNYLEWATRLTCDSESCPCNGYTNKFYLKGGACLGFTTGTVSSAATIFPEESATVSKSPAHGVIFIDTNGDEEPNVTGKDQFLLPLNSGGIWYD